ncbi:XRE family transcriptional regulator [Parashewanella curva]|uniref:XRE family transcriptional regulator n=1 Tax=Parashewanella curva TaxID=2338552 RepID=A0A3L8PRK6_9GAMM|nr:XRE family transcriptional regulator [Parashewanella curva]RLV58031.1 XRE family transcriptional regulator [Parashewanella curva]
MNTVAERLDYLLKHVRVTQVELAKRLNVNQQAISRVCTGYTKNSKLILPICQELGANPTWVLSGEGEPFIQRHSKRHTIELPMITWAQALDWESVANSLETSDFSEYWAVSAKVVSENSYVLRVRGDAMESHGTRNVPEGAVIVVEPTSEYQSGDLVIAKLSNAKEAVFKQILVEGNQVYLKSFNSQYPLIPFDDGAEVVGVVKQAVMQFC